MQTYLVFNICHADGSRETLTVDSERALVGSGAHCEIRLPAEEVESEHLAIRVYEGSLHAEAKSVRPPPSIDGKPFTRADIPAGASIRIGHVELIVSITTDANKVVRAGASKVSPAVYVMLVVAACAVGFAIFKSRRVDSDPKPPAQLPELWAKDEHTCPQRAAEPAAQLGLELGALADSK